MSNADEREEIVQERPVLCDPIRELQEAAPQVLSILLKDRTANRNILFATDAYAEKPGCGPQDSMKVEHFRGGNALSIRPRAAKSALEQRERTRQMAEVFTPTWLCNVMNNVLDEVWFGQPEVFTVIEGAQTWSATEQVSFEPAERWRDYVASRRMEITCGEAPFLASRYDTTTGEPILPLKRRIGLLDRKLRVVDENAATQEEWAEAVRLAFRSIYGYEFQGDSLLLARVNLFMTFWDHHLARWGEPPSEPFSKEIAETISWNLWQMDGFTNRPPFTTAQNVQGDLFAAPDPNACDPCRIRIGTNPISVNNLQGDKTMKFDFIVGNPPYQDEAKGDNETYAPPTYHRFLDSAYTLSDRVEMIHPARFLFNAGSTPKAWNEKMLADPHLKVEFYEPDATKVFPDTSFMGGIAITYRDATRDFGAIGTFIPWPELVATFKKVVLREGFKSLMEILHTQTKFNLEALYKDHPEYKEKIGSDGRDRRFRNNIFDKVDCFHAAPSRLGQTGMLREGALSKDEIAVYGVIKNKRVQRYIDRKYVDESHENLAKWKVFVPRANGSGALGEVLTTPLIGEPMIGEPMVGSTQTFISFGSFDTKAEAEACLKYLKTKFTRAMLGILKITQDNDRDRWAYVPLQDFTAESGIDWGKSVAEIDRQLYKKYGLSEDEIAFIESKVEEME